MSASDPVAAENEIDRLSAESPDAGNSVDAEPSGERWARQFGCLLLIVAPLIAYANTFNVPFVFDGFNYIVEKEWIADIWSGEPAKVHKFFQEAQTRPLVYLSFAQDYRLSMALTTAYPSLVLPPQDGQDSVPTGHYLPVWHVTNLAIHIIAGLALYGFARAGFRSPKLDGRFARSAERIALTVALLWVVHPLNTQSVTYLYQRHESMMGMFYFLTLYLFTRFAAGGRRAWVWACLSVSACLCGMGSKEVMISAPLVVLWYDMVFVARTDRAWAARFLARRRTSLARRRSLRRLATWFAKSPMWELVRRRGLCHLAIFATLFLLARLMIDTAPAYANAGIADVSRVTPPEYAVTQLGVVRRYMQLAVFPVGLNIDYAWPKPLTWPMTKTFPYITLQPTEIEDPRAIVFPGIFMGGVLLLTLISVFRFPAIGFLAGTFFVILAPTSSIVPIIDFCFEHRMYVPLASILTLAIVAVNAWLDVFLSLGLPRRRLTELKTVLVAIAALTLVAITLDRNHDYRSRTALWDDAQQKAPKNPRAKYNHGVYLQIEGKPETIDRAIEQYHETLKLDPNYSSAHLNLANIYLYRNQLEAAETHYRELLRLAPTHSEGRLGLADTLFRESRYYDARYELERLLNDEPENAGADRLLKRVMEAINHPMPAATGKAAVPHPAP